MADTCARCSQQIGFRRFFGASLCGECSATEKAERQAALVEYRSLSAALSDTRADPATIGRNLPTLAERAGIDARKQRDLNWTSLLGAFERALEDEVITAQEEERLGVIATTLGFGRGDLERAITEYREQFFIARVNDGRIPVLESPVILLKRGETAHLQVDASLLKEVTIREYRGGSQGVSFRIAKGVSYRVGSHRGTMQIVGTRLEVADSGPLTITSHRAVFTGGRKSVEVRYEKMLSMNIYGDAIQFHVSNRQNPSLFRVDSGPMVAAAVNAAAQDHLG